MKVCFRVDASIMIGTGHVMRCLTLASELRQQGAEVVFICRRLAGDYGFLIVKNGFEVLWLQEPSAAYEHEPSELPHAPWLEVHWEIDGQETQKVLAAMHSKPDWLVIDSYAIDARWEGMMRPYVGRIMVIDDIADRPHDCDLLLDQNLYPDMESRYDKLVPISCQKLLGPRFALLRHEFSIVRKNLRQRDGHVRRLLVFLGGVDPTHETEKVLDVLATITEQPIAIDVVVGNGNPHREQIEHFCSAHAGFNYCCQVDNMAEVMATADLMIGAGGSTTWERCSLALPSITIVIAGNQRATTAAVAAAGATLSLGESRHLSTEMLATAITRLLTDPFALIEMGRRAYRLMGDAETGREMLLHAICGDSHAAA